MKTKWFPETALPDGIEAFEITEEMAKSAGITFGTFDDPLNKKTRTNASIKAHYEEGHDYTSDGWDEESREIWRLGYGACGTGHRTLLEIGCGDGKLACDMAAFANVWACDYVEPKEPIRSKFVHFHKCDFKEVPGQIDLVEIVVMKGVLEHMDDPFDTLKWIAENIKPDDIITSSPSFLNPRGYIWMALQLLFDYEMSLADIHFILPSDMEAWAEKIGYDIEYKSVDQDWGHGERLIQDFEKRLPKVFKDIEADIPKFMAWLEKTLPYTNYTEDSGATIVYNLRRT